jgi:hypothetical protein
MDHLSTLRDPEFGTPHVVVDRVDWRAKRHPGSIRASVFYTATDTDAPLDVLSAALQRLEDVVEVVVIRADPKFRPQVQVWFEAP